MATPNNTFDNNEGIFDAGEVAISNVQKILDESYAHRGQMAHLLLDYFGTSDEDSDVEVAVFAKNGQIRARLHERESEHKREATQARIRENERRNEAAHGQQTWENWSRDRALLVQAHDDQLRQPLNRNCLNNSMQQTNVAFSTLKQCDLTVEENQRDSTPL